MRIPARAPLNLAAQLGIDLRALGNPVTVGDLAPGEFVLAIDENTIASGGIQEISQTGSSSRVSLWGDGFYAHLASPALYFRVDNDVHTTTPTRFERLLGDRPTAHATARPISAILDILFEPTAIRFSDEGKHVVIQDATDHTWKRRVIRTVERNRSAYGDDFTVKTSKPTGSIDSTNNLIPITDVSTMHVLTNPKT